MAVTRADLAPGRRSTDLSSKTGSFLMVLSILCGIFSFVLCLIAETTRSKVTWVLSSNTGQERTYECIYNVSGRTPLLCAAGAFVGLAIAMIMEHVFMLIAVSTSTPPALIAWTPDSRFPKALIWHAGFFFVTAWICFAVAEVLMMIGLGVESGHLRKWSRPRPSCLIVREGLFSAAGVFGLTAVLFAAGLYLTALRAQNLQEEEDNARREVLDASILYASPPRSPRHRIAPSLNENSRVRQYQNDQYSGGDPSSLNKSMNPLDLDSHRC
ncbi:hypothetical protein HHK36_020842 [Tetracentron sinense]|uniref:Transmembrane protein n=1 Tax=Tetracentron sinense TaxID=13715 RepID=A0A834YYD5_TETSI|nr:hypothetical protein HHK36_020842 [Tetracentron sinense]